MLTVTKAGVGLGHVASAPAGIGCGATCQHEFPHGAVVVLTGISGVGTEPVAWGGCDAIVAGNRCSVTLDAAVGITATFGAIPPAEGGDSSPPPAEEGEAAESEPRSKKASKKKQRQRRLQMLRAKRKKTLARCAKVKAKQARARCFKRARSIGKPKRAGAVKRKRALAECRKARSKRSRARCLEHARSTARGGRR
jgi:hypothetical protein